MSPLSLIFSIVAAIVSVILTALVGMVLANVRTMNDHLEQLNGKFFAHVTTANNHEAGFARVEEQIKSLLQAVTVAHKRLDHLQQQAQL